MSKLYSNYLKIKEKENNTVLLFKSGIFYIFLDEDATKMSEKLGLKLTLLNDKIVKCGFPMSALSKYVTILNENEIPYKIIESNFTEVNSIDEYIEKTDALKIIKSIKDLDINNISPVEALNILTNIKNKL